MLDGNSFNDLGELVTFVADSVLVPPERLTVSQAAAKYRYLDNEGSFVGEWNNDETPYLVEPMDVLTSREFESCIFVGPAQGGKTEIILNWIAYTAKCDPADFFLIQTARDTARDFSYRRIDKMHRDSKELGAMLRPGSDNDNIFDKFYRNGMMLASLNAGMAFSNAILGAVHAMAHSLGGETDAPHGECNALLLGPVVGQNFCAAPDRYREIARRLGLTLPAAEPKAAAALADGLERLRRQAGLTRSLRDLGVSRKQLRRMMENALADPCMATNPRRYSAEEVVRIYEQVY